MIEYLLAAVQNGKNWTEKCTRSSYAASFKCYCQQYEAAYVSAIQNSDDLNTLARHLIEAIALGWNKRNFLRRSAIRTDEKMIIVTYLTPMLLNAESPKCTDFARVLCEEWNARWPNNTYNVADYQSIQSGFRHSVLGFTIPQK